jgi:hypothetical protein
MGRSALALGAMVLLSGFAATRLSAACDVPGVSVTQEGAGNIDVHVCTITTGCLPHNPQSAVVGSQIRVTYTQAELPDCACVQPTFEFNDTVLLHPAAPGHYTATVIFVNCGQPTTIGTADFQLDAASAIPLLGARALAALAVFIAMIAVWRLRG